jgi:Icc-related predicted phosphoesterase
MKCLIVADLHYSLPQFDWVVNSADKFDVVIMAGDHLDLSSAVDMRAQVVVVRKYMELIRKRTQLIVCSGNHDLDLRDENGEKTASWLAKLGIEHVATDGGSLLLGDTLFTICPWWDGPIKQQHVTDQLAAAAATRPHRWVWINHATATESPTSWTGSKHWGDQVLRGWVEAHQPDLVFSGHVHEAPFVKNGSWADKVGKTWMFNVGQYVGAPPAHIIVDTEAGEALWLSAAGVQLVNFASDLVRPIPNITQPPAWLTSGDRARGPSPAQS